jgi:hypothetical protein
MKTYSYENGNYWTLKHDLDTYMEAKEKGCTAKLIGSHYTFTSPRTGTHSISRDSSSERVWAHWQGFIQRQSM